MNGRSITVVLADDHPLTRKGTDLQLATDPMVRVIGSVSSYPELMTTLARQVPDIVVLDLSGMGAPFFTMVASIRRAYPAMAIIILSSHMNVVAPMLKLGVMGYVAKEEDEEYIVTAIHVVIRGQVFLSSKVAAWYQNLSREQQHLKLTAKECDVLRLNADGLKIVEIAAELGIDEGTVGNHFTAIRRKTGLYERTELANWYRKMFSVP